MSWGNNILQAEQTFADWFRERVGGRSQRQVARASGASQTAIGNYLVTTLPDLNDPVRVARLAAAIGVTAEELCARVRAEQDRRLREAVGYIEPQPLDAIQSGLARLRAEDRITPHDQVEIDRYIRDRIARRAGATGSTPVENAASGPAGESDETQSGSRD